jgi:hypothetical protein
MFFQLKKEGIPDIYDYMDEPEDTVLGEINQI